MLVCQEPPVPSLGADLKMVLAAVADRQTPVAAMIQALAAPMRAAQRLALLRQPPKFLLWFLYQSICEPAFSSGIVAGISVIFWGCSLPKYSKPNSKATIIAMQAISHIHPTLLLRRCISLVKPCLSYRIPRCGKLLSGYA
jgi:hypothetical protein